MRKFEDIASITQCSFKPRVNKSLSPPRDPSTYIRDQESYQLSRQRKIREKQVELEAKEVSKINESHISKGSQRLLAKVDRYKRSPSPLEVSTSLYEQGKHKLFKMTKEETEIKHYLNQKASWAQQRALM